MSSDRGDSSEPSPAASGGPDDGGALFGGDPSGSVAPRGGSILSDARGGGAITDSTRDASPVADGDAPPAVPSNDAEVGDLQTIGCPDKAACPTGQVCCARLFQDGGAIIAFDDAGALETTCQSSCTAGTSPLCAMDADCGDAGGACFKDPPTSARGVCTGSFTPVFPTFPLADSGH